MPYQPNIPTGTVPLDQDYLNLQGNFQSLNTVYATDHVGLTITNPTSGPGYHKSIHFVVVSNTVSNPPNNQPVVEPPTTAGFGQMYTAGINDGQSIDTALYFKTSAGNNIQLTRNFLPTAGSPGSTFLPGGLIMQWGTFNLSTAQGQQGDVFYTIPFTTNSYHVQLTLICKAGGTSSSNNTISVIENSLTSSKFRFNYRGAGAGEYTKVFWLAIGF